MNRGDRTTGVATGVDSACTIQLVDATSPLGSNTYVTAFRPVRSTALALSPGSQGNERRGAAR